MTLRKKIIGCVAAAVAAAGILASAPLASAQTNSAPPKTEVSAAGSGLYITEIKCYDTEDWADDEIYLMIKNKYGDFRKYVWLRSPQRFWDGRNLRTKIRIYSGDEIHVYDDDAPDADDHLGWRNAYWKDQYIHYGSSSRHYHYRLRVKPLYW